MKRKLLLAIALGAVVSVAAAVGVGCSNPNSADNTPKHNYGAWVIDREASCTRIGQKYHVCQDEGCNSLEWEAIPMIPHDYIIDITITKEKHIIKCSMCNDSKSGTHTFNNDSVCTICTYEQNTTIGLEYRLNSDNSSYSVIDYKGSQVGSGLAFDLHLSIPAFYHGLPVTRIEKLTSIYYSPIVSIKISKNVNYVGSWISEVKSEIIVDKDNQTFRSINGNLFSKDGTSLLRCCSWQKQCEIPDSVTKIGHSAFDGCTNLTEIIVSENNEYYKTIDGNLYSKDGTTLVRYIGKQTEFEIPNTVTTIGSYAFSNCTTLKNITLHENLLIIEAFAFYGCTSLETATFENATGWRAGKYNINVVEGEEVLLTTDELSNTAQAAKYLMDKYCNYSWINSKIFENNN